VRCYSQLGEALAMRHWFLDHGCGFLRQVFERTRLGEETGEAQSFRREYIAPAQLPSTHARRPPRNVQPDDIQATLDCRIVFASSRLDRPTVPSVLMRPS